MPRWISNVEATCRWLPDTPLIQLCFTVPDLEVGVADVSRLVGAGPWFRVPPLSADKDQTTLRGRRFPLGADIALAYGGETMYELVAPRAGSVSIFSERVARYGHGLHHFGFSTTRFLRDSARWIDMGGPALMTSVTGRGARVMMVEGEAPPAALHELIEITAESGAFYDRLHRAARARPGGTSRFTDLRKD